MENHELLQPPPPQEDSRIGMVLQDRYKIIRKLGEGGMGAVYEGEHVLIKRRVAIKCLHSQFAQSGDIVARFHREALAATSVGNEHIIEVTDMGRFPDGSVFMVLEYLAGHDLSKEIEIKGPLPVGRVVHVAAQVCEALGAAHDKGIVHRDLKPENVFLIMRSGDPDFVKVLDFGISKFKDSGEGGGNHSMTRTGMAMGTPYYMAPEQAHGHKDVDHRVDIYALGVMMFRALTGVLPFDDESYPMLVVKICTQPPPSVRQYRPDVPPALEAIVTKMLAKDKNERFPDCASIRAAILPFKSLQDTPVVTTGSTMFADALGPPTPMLGSNVPVATPTAIEGGRTVAPASTSAGMSASTSGALPVPSGGRRLGLVLGGLAVVMFLGAGVVYTTKNSNTAAPPTVTATPPQPPPTAPNLPTTATNTTPTVGANAGTGAPSARMVRIQISSNPDSAQLFLDGSPISNPFDADLPSSTEPHHIEARLTGFTTQILDLSLAYGQRIPITLRRGQGVEDRRTVRTATANAPTAVDPALLNAIQRSAHAPPPPAGAEAIPAPQPAHVEPVQPPPSEPPAHAETHHAAEPTHASAPVVTAPPPPANDPPPTNPAVVVPPQAAPLRHRAF